MIFTGMKSQTGSQSHQLHKRMIIHLFNGSYFGLRY
jgi:hypothetical protein